MVIQVGLMTTDKYHPVKPIVSKTDFVFMFLLLRDLTSTSVPSSLVPHNVYAQTSLTAVIQLHLLYN